MTWKVLPLLLAMIVLLLGACNGGNDGSQLTIVCPSKEPSAASADMSSLTLEDVYERMAEAMTCPGYALHVVTTQEWEIIYPEYGKLSAALAGNTWIDLPADRAREEMRIEYTARGENREVLEERESESLRIVLGDAAYTRDIAEEPTRGHDALKCHGSESAAFSLLLNCFTYTEDSVTRFEPDAEYAGRRMPALVTEGQWSGSDETTVFTQSLYLHPDPLLPLVSIMEGAQNGDRPLRREARYEYEFVLLDSLAQDFFDPAAIGYVEPDPEEKLRGADVGITVYWLGVEFPGAEGLPPLSLRKAYPAGPSPPGYRAVVEYRPADDRFGPPVLDLQEFPRAEWEAFLAQSRGGNFWDEPCTQKTHIDMGDRRAIMFGGYEQLRRPFEGCPEQPPDKWGAYVYIGDTVVLISIFGHVDGGEYIPSPYSSARAMEVVVRGLVPRQ